MTPPDVLVRHLGRVGRITLNRPQALNALTLSMLHHVGTTLRRWEDDPSVEVVVLDGAGDRGFCAGGDIRLVHDSARAGDRRAREFWAAEFALDAYVFHYPKTVVSLVDGITLGGGVGLACHRPVRVATERSQLAMPEVRIGFAPDVAGTWLLGRAPGRLGEHLALTGDRMDAADALACGLVDHVVPANSLPLLIERLQTRDVSSAVADLHRATGQSGLIAEREWLDLCYAADGVEEILARLHAARHPHAMAAAERITAAAPTAVKVTLRALRQARRLTTIEEVLVRDYRMMCRFLESSDLVTGIRATTIDKTGTPRWSPASLEDVDEAMVDRYFAPLPDAGELQVQMPSWSR